MRAKIKPGKDAGRSLCWRQRQARGRSQAQLCSRRSEGLLAARGTGSRGSHAKRSPCQPPERANVSATTRLAPPEWTARAHARRVAPVVTTSSTRITRGGGGCTRRTRGGSASRSARGRPTWRLPCVRLRQRLSGIPAWPARATAIASAGSKPRRRRRQGAGGTGTIVPSRSSAGARSAIAWAARSASDSRAPNLSAATSSRPAPSYGTADQTGPRPRTGARWEGKRSSRNSQASHSCRGVRQPPAQSAQRGGATRATRCESTLRWSRGNEP